MNNKIIHVKCPYTVNPYCRKLTISNLNEWKLHILYICKKHNINRLNLANLTPEILAEIMNFTFDIWAI